MILFGKKKKEPLPLPHQVHQTYIQALRLAMAQLHLTPEQALDKMFSEETLSAAEREQFIRELNEPDSD